jgi:4a-hydroxytetrahydrobiopterin dehydratase
MIEGSDLAGQTCEACTPSTPVLKYPRLKKLLGQVPLWRYEKMGGAPALTRHFRFAKYSETITFVNKVAEIAEREGHHPEIYIGNYNQVVLSMSTHAINDLSENDFIMAAKIDAIS